MILNTSAAYWPMADEVVISLGCTQDDQVTVAVPDSVQFQLLLQITDPIGAKSFLPLQQVTVSNKYVRPDQTIACRFRSPKKRSDLYLQSQAAFGPDVYSKTVQIGISNDPRSTMALPDNKIWEINFEDFTQTGGDAQELLPENKVVMAPELVNYTQNFNFTTPQPPEVYEPLTYTGGGADRLLINSQTSSYQKQLSAAPWSLPAFLFLEDAQTQLLDNAYFLTGNYPNPNFPTQGNPTGWSVDSAGAVLTQTLQFDHQTSSDAKVWTTRYRQQNSFTGFNTVQAMCSQEIPVTAEADYTFSAYFRVRLMTSETIVSNLTLTVTWFDDTTQLSQSSQSFQTSGFQNLTLASLTATAPASANIAMVQVQLSEIDGGDDVELSIFAPQFETGDFATTRLLTSRTQDQVVIPTYNAADQKIRFQMVMGFAQDAGFLSVAPQSLTTGPLAIQFTPGNIVVTLQGGSTMMTALTFNAGDPLDLTFSHQTNGKLQLYRSGTLLNEVTLGSIPATTDPLTILGIGVELLELDVFSRV